MMPKYFGSFDSLADVQDRFRPGEGDPFPTEEEMLVADYQTEMYEGDAFVLFQKDGKLFEVHGSHCSCYGLEDQWDPEETTWAALRMRNPGYGAPGSEAWERLIELMAENDNGED